MITKNEDPGRKDVSVCLESSGVFHQPATFRCCPLGIQFYSDHPMQEDLVLEVALEVPSAGAYPHKVSCAGVVVQSVLENPRHAYRNWVYFLDISPSVKEQLQCFSKDAKSLCPYCENF